MNRQVLVAGVAVAALACGLSACGGSDSKATPKSTETATTPAVPVQPRGANGVTYDIQNWDDYADDPAVLAWKTTNEAIGASVNADKVLPAARSGVSKPVLRLFTGSIQQAWKNDWHVKSVGKIKVQSVKTSGATADLVMCVWGSSVGYYSKNDKYVGQPEDYWREQQVAMKMDSGAWIMSAVKYTGKCKGGPPA